MANKYVDFNTGEGFTTDQAGTSGDPFKGCYGMQKALDTVAAGETIYVTGTLNLNKLVSFTVGANKTATWVVGDVIRNNTGSGNHWTAVLCEITASTILGELDTGDYGTVTTSEGIENTTRSDTVTCSAKVCPGLVVDTTDGTYTNNIKVYGCNNATSWTVGTLALLTTSTKSHVDTAITSTKAYYWLKYIDIYNFNSHGYSAAGGENSWAWEFCISRGNGGHGFALSQYTYRGRFVQCKAYSNGNDGICAGTQYFINNCKIYSNGNHGVEVGDNSCVIGNLIYTNAYNNINIYNGVVPVTILNNVIHGQTNASYNGINCASSSFPVYIKGNRITGNAGYGIRYYWTTPEPTYDGNYSDYNYFQSNDNGARYAILKGANDIDGSDDNYGYTDYTNGDFSLVSSASLRRTAINLDW